MFDWVLLGSLVIGFSLGYSVVGSSLESLVIGSSLRSSLGSSALLFWYAVCYQLHQQLEEFAMIFDSFLWKFDSITGYLDKFLKREKRLHFRFLTGFRIHQSRVIYIQKYSSLGIPKDSFSERFFKISTKASLTGCFSKKL